MSNPLKEQIRNLADPEAAKKCLRFFKTGPGEYGEGDLFLGVKTPDLRQIAKHNWDANWSHIRGIVRSKYHEERMTGLILLVDKYARASNEDQKQKIYEFYCDHFKYINNWDLIDVTCPHILGKHLMDRDRRIVYRWIKSENMWIRRIGVLTNMWWIRRGDVSEVYKISKALLKDPEDLMHKAVGWSLREAGKKDLKGLENFLQKHGATMPRTMLRYSIEKFPERKRKYYLKK